MAVVMATEQLSLGSWDRGAEELGKSRVGFSGSRNP